MNIELTGLINLVMFNKTICSKIESTCSNFEIGNLFSGSTNWRESKKWNKLLKDSCTRHKVEFPQDGRYFQQKWSEVKQILHWTQDGTGWRSLFMEIGRQY